MLVTSRKNIYGRNIYLPMWSLLSFALLKALLLTLAISVCVTLLRRGASNLCTGVRCGRPQQCCTAGTFLPGWRRGCQFLTLYMTLGVGCVTCGVVVYMTGILCVVFEDDTGLRCSVVHYKVQSCITYLGEFRLQVQAL